MRVHACVRVRVRVRGVQVNVDEAAQRSARETAKQRDLVCSVMDQELSLREAVDIIAPPTMHVQSGGGSSRGPATAGGVGGGGSGSGSGGPNTPHAVRVAGN